MTSRVRCTHPPVRVVWHSGQDSGAWTTRRVGVHPRPGKAVGTLFARLLFLFRRLLAPGGRRVARHPGLRATAGQPGFQALYPLPHLGNGVLLFRDDSPLFRDNRQQGFPARLLQVQFRSIVLLCHNCAPTASVFIRTAAFGKFTSSTLNCYIIVALLDNIVIS